MQTIVNCFLSILIGSISFPFVIVLAFLFSPFNKTGSYFIGYLMLYAPFVVGAIACFMLGFKNSWRQLFISILIVQSVLLLLFTLVGPEGVYTDSQTCIQCFRQVDGNLICLYSQTDIDCVFRELERNIRFLWLRIIVISTITGITAYMFRNIIRPKPRKAK